MTKEFLTRFQAIVKLIRLCSKAVGCDITDPNYYMGILTWFVILAIHFFFTVTFYTIYVGIYVEGEWTSVLQTLCMVGSAVQGYSKLISAISKRKVLIFILDDLASIYEHYGLKHERYKSNLNTSINVVTKVIKSIAMLYFVITWVLILGPLYLRFFRGRREFVMQFLLPGIDHNTDAGYIIVNCVQVMCLVFGSFGNFAGDMYFFTFTSHMPLLASIFRCKLEDLNLFVEDHPTEKRKSLELLKDIFEWHQKYLRYIILIKDVYFWVLLIQIITISSSIGCSVFCILLGKWPVGFLYVLYCFVMLYIYCGLGTLVEISSDDFTTSCYLDAEWYKYSVQEQKLLQIMLRMSQNTAGLTVGAVLPLSMSTGLQVTKTVYTFTMIYIILIKDVYFWVLLIQIITISSSIGCSVFCILLGKWPVGFLYVLYCFVMLYIYCGLGTLVEISSDDFTTSCYLDAEWYKYSVQEQKLLQIMLRMSQNTAGLTVGAVLPLSMSTGLQVTKTVYTFTMMLVNFLD